MTMNETPSRDELFAALENVTLAEARSFRRRLKKARAPKALQEIGAEIHAAAERVALTDAAVPTITYPDALPVTARKDDIAEAIRDNQVVIIAGETGSGKTTQIPKICLDLGRGRRGLIGHTQPRRIAARTVAERIASELDQKIGESVGYAIRFDDRVSETTAVKLMTDGILLAEMQRDRFLNKYDTIIIDEAHERSLNIDFLLGYLKRLLPKRADLKVIITSATIDPESFAAHFADADGNPAPIIEVSGRTYPVEIRYRPLEFEAGGKVVDQDPLDGLTEAIEELMHEGDGDILCFFPGERDIRDAMEAIEGKKWKNVEVTPLFGRLSNQEQHRVFSEHRGRRIVLATNIAETSLTVPGIRYVVDTGTARISRYSTRTKVQRLPIEPISQASANQRSGRCGRVADGIAIRLYSEQDFESRSEFTDPEILRTNLASVILQMVSLKLGDIEQFPFIQPPEHKAIRDGLNLLHELGALHDKQDKPTLTATGRDLARIPLDPRMARMLIEANTNGCLDDVMIIVAAMTIQDVRERPLDFQAQADQAHARFKDKSSDFLSMLKLWDYIKQTRNEQSGNKFRKRMKQEFLHYMRIREWFDLVRQLKDVAKQLGWTYQEGTERRADDIHMTLLSGLLSNIGARDGNSKEFQGARNTRFLVFPGSALAKKPPEFLMAAELVETSRLWARDVATIDPAWVEKLGADLLKHNYSEPTWSRKRAAAIAHQKSTLYGVPIVADRTVPYHRVDPTAARDMFIRNALVAGDWNTHHAFFKTNAQALDDAAAYEEKARRRGLIVDEDTLFDFYDQRIPAKVTTGRHFDSWWKKERRRNPELLDFDPAKLIDDSHEVTEESFPDHWRKGSIDYELTYKFEPGDPLDGVTVMVPIPMLAGLDTEGFDWLVPGLRLELVTELIRSLPKALRRTVVPAPEFAERAIDRLVPYEGTITQQLADVLHELGGQGINATDFQPGKLPMHLRMNYGAIDKRGKIVDSDRDLAALIRRQSGHIKSSVSRVSRTAESTAVSEWTDDTLGAIDDTVTTNVDGHEVTAYPALVATKDGVELKVHPTKAAADAAMVTTTLTLLMRDIAVNTAQMVKGLPLQQRVAVDSYPHGGADGLVNDARVAAIRDLMLEAGGPVRTPSAFQKLKDTIKPQVPGRVRQAVVAIAPGLAEYSNLRAELAHWDGATIDDMREQLELLLPRNAITIHGMSHLRHLPRYIQAMRIRLEDMNLDPDRDADRQAEVDNAKAYLANRLRSLPPGREKTREVKDIRWMVEELRVSLFAQRLGTAHAVSLRRIQKAVDKLR
ncbi:ATP-dependent RNA helicase HrpA [Corynebacterium kefirresidentii]|uniref:ATP-dependent RNA helicase HrpA n=1 Tax=Corynebacterium TaxID=1716 RepID=UPI0003B8D345|nr:MULTISPECIES: ATP-dependent RNA helicase HrpA [Corynebacterium]ERS47078.1 ATP-dependent helicase HrpA [Corynebacterium sp. KPL1856]ERS47545.1 ATP-dependent helicase HrpA [Corynebacterium sp. KPL1860]ERS57340.1 ATP-dependent helicase HrpA [Corynebacterium sp. KPL1821]ERS62416.1 ATP-dependent helicase HrpA [Corynebacterium sp. KPL1817]ERS76961.1 ATP-dependent helicase HrpA [Corynebacterium sp. KPL1857]